MAGTHVLRQGPVQYSYLQERVRTDSVKPPRPSGMVITRLKPFTRRRNAHVAPFSRSRGSSRRCQPDRGRTGFPAVVAPRATTAIASPSSVAPGQLRGRPNQRAARKAGGAWMAQEDGAEG